MGRPKLSEEERVVTRVRLPESVHRRLLDAAAERDVSVNLLVTRAVTDYLAQLPPTEQALAVTAAAVTVPRRRTAGRPS